MPYAPGGASSPHMSATTDGPLTRAGLYKGETVDFRRELPGWSRASFDDSGWTPVDVVPVDRAILEPRISPPVRVVDERPMARTEHADRVLLDAGQNVAGWVRLTVRGRAGDTVTIVIYRGGYTMQADIQLEEAGTAQ